MQHGQANITVTALEDGAHLLADPVEIRETAEEGIAVLPGRGPRRCMVDEHGRLVGLETVRVVSLLDEQGRFAPQYDDDDVQMHVADMVIEAIGQQADTSLLGEELIEALEWERGRLKTDVEGRSSAGWLWAAGDVVTGPDVIHAVADGHRVAASIEACLGRERHANG